MSGLGALAGLFASAFIAATILPAQSEAVLIAMLLASDYAPWLLVLVASVGNVLGALLNWGIGRRIAHYQNRPWFPATPGQLDRAMRWYSRWGRWSLLLSWLPIGGDALTVVAGVLREPLASFLALVTIAKTGRYVVLAAFTLGLAQ
jgi:membrane protein YqaA with SNARE-associated domain